MTAMTVWVILWHDDDAAEVIAVHLSGEAARKQFDQLANGESGYTLTECDVQEVA